MECLIDTLPGQDPSTRLEVWKRVADEDGAVTIELRLLVDQGTLGWLTQRRIEIDELQAQLLRNALGLAGGMLAWPAQVLSHPRRADNFDAEDDDNVISFAHARRRFA